MASHDPGGFPSNPPPSGYPPPSQDYSRQPPPIQSSGIPANVAATLCYALGWLTGIIFLVLEPYSRDRNVRFHAWQSIFVFGGLFAAHIGLTIMSIVASHILGILGMLFSILILLLHLGGFVLWVILMIKAYQGEKWMLPVVGPLAQEKV